MTFSPQLQHTGYLGRVLKFTQSRQAGQISLLGGLGNTISVPSGGPDKPVRRASRGLF